MRNIILDGFCLLENIYTCFSRMSRYENVIESIDGGIVRYNKDEEDEIDAMNADTFGGDFDTGDAGFFDTAAAPMVMMPTLVDKPAIGERQIPLDMLFPKHQQKHKEVMRQDFVVPPAPPGLSLRMAPPPPPPPPAPPAMLSVSTRFHEEGIMHYSSMVPPQQSIHVIPVRVFPTPFTVLQREQALAGGLDNSKWGHQRHKVDRSGLMSARDKEFVTKIQLNQMVALSGSLVQNYKGKFTFSRSQPAQPMTEIGEQPEFGKKLYSSVYHPRKLLDYMGSGSSGSGSGHGSRDTAARASTEKCFDLLLDVVDVDEYISTLHPLAEDKIHEAIVERTELLLAVTKVIVGDMKNGGAKAVKAKKRAIDSIVELLQPRGNASDAEARKSLIFRRVPEQIQAVYIDMLEQIVGDDQ